MNAYLVIFHPDPNGLSPNVRHRDFLAAFESFRGYRLSDSTVLIVTEDNVDTVWHKLFLANEKDFSKIDRLYIVSVCKPFRAYGKPPVSDWVEDQLSESQGTELWDYLN